jgi:serine/threonine-protein kinase RsbW
MMINKKIIGGILEEYLKKFPDDIKKDVSLEVTDNRVKIALDGDIHSLRALNVLVNVLFKHIASASSDKFLVFDLTLAIEESIINIFSHSYPEHRGKVVVDILFKSDGIAIMITDYGKKGCNFNLKEKLASRPADTFAESGRGIMLIRKVVDDISYKSENGVNMLRLIKKIG